MTSEGATFEGGNMDEEGGQREAVKGSPNAGLGQQNNTAVGSGEERTPQVARQLELGSPVRAKSSVRRSSSLSSIRRKNQARTALRQERLSPIADTVVKKITQRGRQGDACQHRH